MMAGHVHAARGIGFVPLALMWFAMMAAMMAPTVLPWITAFHRLGGSTAQFA
jgi:predicted metal-binding membrane protein